MPKKQNFMTIQGLDIERPAEWINDNMTPDTQNMTVDRGVLRKRWGTSTIGVYTSGSTFGYISGAIPNVMGGYELLRQSVKYIVRVGVAKIQKYNTTTLRWEDITGTDLTGTATDAIDFASPLLSGYPILIITNGIDAIQKYTGTGSCAALGGSPPKAYFAEAFDEYLMLAKTNDGNERNQRVTWSDTGDAETWTGGNSGSKDLIDTDEEITGLARYGNYMTVHKENSIYLGYKVSSSTIFKFDRKNTKGTICNNTIQQLPNGEMSYLANDGWRIFNGISSTLIISPVTDELRDSLNPEYVEVAWSVVVEEIDEVWLGVAIGSQTTPETVYKYNYRTGACFKDTVSNATTAFKYTAGSTLTWDDFTITWAEATTRWNDSALSNLFKRIAIGDSSGYTYYSDKTVNNDNGVAIDAYWESKDLIMDQLGQMARFGVGGNKPSMEIWAKGNTVDVYYSTDSGQTWTLISAVTLGSDYPSDTSPLPIYFDVLSTKIRFRFRNDTLGESFYLKSYVFNYTPVSYRTA